MIVSNCKWIHLNSANSFDKVKNKDILMEEQTMTHVRFDYSNALSFFGEHELTYLRDAVKAAHHSIHGENRCWKRLFRMGRLPSYGV